MARTTASAYLADIEAGLKKRGITFLSNSHKSKIEWVSERLHEKLVSVVLEHFSRVRHPEQYLTDFSPGQILRHVQLLSQLEKAKPVALIVTDQDRDHYRIVIGGLDRLGAFASIAGNMARHGLNILEIIVVTYNRDVAVSLQPEPRYVMELFVQSQTEVWPSRAELEGVLGGDILNIYPPKKRGLEKWAEIGTSIGLTKGELRGTCSSPIPSDWPFKPRTENQGMSTDANDSLDRSRAQYEADREKLMETHEGQWVAYVNGTRVAAASNKQAILDKCFQGEGDKVKVEELFVTKVSRSDNAIQVA